MTSTGTDLPAAFQDMVETTPSPTQHEDVQGDDATVLRP
jgi:hypothetical protein